MDSNGPSQSSSSSASYVEKNTLSLDEQESQTQALVNRYLNDRHLNQDTSQSSNGDVVNGTDSAAAAASLLTMEHSAASPTSSSKVAADLKRKKNFLAV